MTAQWADFPSGDVGLYNYDKTKMLDGIWAENDNCALVDDLDPNIGSSGRCVQILNFGAGGATGIIRKVLTGGRTTVGMSARIWLPSLPTSANRCPIPFLFLDGANVGLCGVGINTTGGIFIYKISSGVTQAVTAGPVITAGAWTHISVKVTFGAGSTASFSIEREGIPILSGTGLDLGGAGPCAQVSHYNRADGLGFFTPMYMKDSFIWDGLGTVNNDHPGPVTVYREPVNADISSGWSRTSGTSDYGLLNESPPVDAGYISAGFSPIPAPSIMGLTDLPPDVVSVRAVFLVGRQRKSDGGDCQTQMSISPNAFVNAYNGANRAITTAFTYQFDVSELSPVTGVAWTPVEFNSAQIKINRTV